MPPAVDKQLKSATATHSGARSGSINLPVREKQKKLQIFLVVAESSRQLVSMLREKFVLKDRETFFRENYEVSQITIFVVDKVKFSEAILPGERFFYFS